MGYGMTETLRYRMKSWYEWLGPMTPLSMTSTVSRLWARSLLVPNEITKTASTWVGIDT